MNFYGQAEQVAERILDAFRNGTVPNALAPVFIERGGRHADGYSWTNRLLIALAGYSDAMGYGAADGSSGWKSVGRQVKKGSKAVYILAPCSKTIDDPKAASGKRTIVYGFRVVNVFGLEQTEIVNPDLWAKHNKGNESSERFLQSLPLREVAESWGLTLGAYKGRGAWAKGWYQHGQAIALGVENLATWAHELVHAADYRNGKLVERGQHWRSETVAELGGAILMLAMGYEQAADLGGAWEYISNYAKAAGMEPIKACMDVIKRTCEAVAAILEESATITGKSPIVERPTTSPEEGAEWMNPIEAGSDTALTPVSAM